MEAARNSQPPPQTEPAAEEGNEVEERQEQQEEDANEVMVSKAQALMDRIVANHENPNPNALHALATILETEESRYMEDTDQSSTNNGRSAHNVGRLGNLLRENDEFFELISSKFLTESRYSVSVQAATTRLLFSCSLTWVYPHVFEDDVLENIRGWVINEIPRLSADDRNWKHETGRRKTPDSEMLRIFSTGLLAVCLACGGQLVEDVLTSGLPAKLMRYLRIRVLGETSTSQKDSSPLIENKSSSIMASSKTREESRSRLRNVTESSHLDLDVSRKHSCEKDRDRDCVSLDEIDRDRERCVSRQGCGDDFWVDEEPLDSMSLEVDPYQVEAEGDEKYNIKDFHESKSKTVGKSHREEDFDENARDDSYRRRIARGFPRSRGKGRSSEGVLENEQALTSPCSGSRAGQARSSKDRSLTKIQDLKRMSEAKRGQDRSDADDSMLERADYDDCYLGCRVGSKDITDLVKQAIRAAEAEARAANAPAVAMRAAADDAAEVVKTAAFEEYRKTNDEVASVAAAARALSTVIDAAKAVSLSRTTTHVGDSGHPRPMETEVSEDIGEFVILDSDSLAKLREKFCIQCLVILGEYVEVLGPVLREKGVDVTLALLQRSFKHIEASSTMLLLHDILKLICTLAAHRKFGQLFVDRGGIQRLLTVPRSAHTLFGLSSCLFTIGSIQGIMERVCALPSNVVHQVVELALQLLECKQDQSRKNAALFFASAFVFRAVIDAFDSQEGLQKLLHLLHDAASVRSGVPPGQLNNPVSLRNDRSSSEVLTSSEKQIAYHTCVALRQYFRAHLLLLVDSVRPTKSIRGAPTARSISTIRAADKPLDISNEAMDAVFHQIQKDRKLGPAFVRARWPVVDKFLNSNGHITMLELCQAPPVERYLHDLLQYALGVLHIVTLVPNSRKLIVNATLSNERVGIAVILDTANGAGYVEPEIVEPALNLLINLVCPPPSISNKSSASMQSQQSMSFQSGNGSAMESRDRNADRAANVPSQNVPRDRSGEPASAERGILSVVSASVGNASSQASASPVASGLVGERRISLGAGAGCAGLAAQLEQGYRQARDAVRANNGIKVLLQLLQPRMVTSPAALDCLRALTCRVLLGLARDDTIAHILTKLQVGKKLSELIRDSGSQTHGGDQNRWQAELAQATIELIGVVTNSGRATTLAASDAATPTLRRIERAAIAAATPISYDPRELLLLVHEHLQASGLSESAAMVLKEAQLTPLPSLAAPSSLSYQCFGQEASSLLIQWPSGCAAFGFLSGKPKVCAHLEDSRWRCDSTVFSSKKKPLASSAALGYSKIHTKLEDSPVSANIKNNMSSKKSYVAADNQGTTSVSAMKSGSDADVQIRTPIVLPMKRKLTDSRDISSMSSGKRLNTGDHLLSSPSFTTPSGVRRTGLQPDANLFCTPSLASKDHHNRLPPNVLPADIDESQFTGSHVGHTFISQHGLLTDPQPCGSERVTLDSLVLQYLKHQHRQCSAPITTLPPLSLLHPHVCPEPRRSLDAPSNVTARLSTREFRSMYGGIHGSRKDRQFVYGRFRPWRTCRDDSSTLLTCISFLGDSSRIATGGHSGELKVFDSNSNSVLESYTSHQFPLTLVQSCFVGENQLVISSSANDVRLWDAYSISGGPKHSFEGIKAARFSNSGSVFAALRSDPSHREILLYDVHTCQLDIMLSDTSNTHSGRGHAYSVVHFNPSDSMLLWNGVLWDRRGSGPIHRFEQFTDHGGGGFHPAGNEVIINSEVWDLRNLRLLRSVPSLDQTVITFNASGDVIYAILRRNLEDVNSVYNTRRVKHPLFSAFRTVDAVNYSDIATVPLDRCVLDFATEPTDSFLGLITMDDQDEMCSSARVYEIGRRKPTDDDSDPDDAESEEDEDDEGDDDSILEQDLVGDGESDVGDMSNDDDGVSEFEDDDDDDGDFMMDGVDFDGDGVLEIVTEGDEDDDSEFLESFSSGDEDLL